LLAIGDTAEGVVVMLAGVAVILLGVALLRLRAWESFARFTARLNASSVDGDSAVQVFKVVAVILSLVGVGWFAAGLVSLL
jgi:hypothetical protein